ncbi:MAG: universal stress protein [Acidobacteriia bacterium]|nr:universal stress protein [Terriglobia bacterium]
MVRFSPARILCPIDFSEHSAAALRMAGSLARAFGAEVRVLHAQRFEAPIYFTSAQLQALNTQLRRSLRSARKFVENFTAQHLPEDVARSVRVVEQEPVEAILRMHKEWRADLLVMGTHGRTGLTRIRLGSVMESVFRQVRSPILTVGPDARVPPVGPIRRVLSPIDFSAMSRETFQCAVDLAERTNAEVIAVHILEGPPEGHDEQAVSALCDWVSPQARARCTVREVVREGTPPERIVAEAKASRADLIVLGARPRSYLGGLVFGSTTEEVIRTAPCPVLSIIQRPSRAAAK